MSAPRLVTRCPACRTAFRLVADQLRLRQGLVRCGQCETVFDAREHLIELPASGTSAPAPATPPAASAASSASSALPAVSTAAVDAGASPPFQGFYGDPGYDVPALDAPTMMLGANTRPADASSDTDGAATETTPPSETAGELSVEAAEAHANGAPAPAIHPPAAADWPALAGIPDEEPDERAAADIPAPQEAEPAHASAVPAWPSLDPDALEQEAPRTIWTPPGRSRVEPTFHSAPSPTTAHHEPVFGHGDGAAEPSFDPVRAEAGERADGSANADAAHHAAPQAGTPLFADTASAVASEQTTRRWSRPEAQPGPAFEPDFLRHTRDRERARPGKADRAPAAPRSRTWLWVLAGVLVVAALLQGAFLMRSQLAGSFPALRPLFEAACAPLGCEVPPWRDLDALRIETSALQRQDENDDQYVLAVTLRNQGRSTTALPAIELVMTDLQDQLLLRRVLQPSEYLDTAQRGFARTGLRAGTELPLRVRFRTQQAAANYRVLLFYP